MSDKFAFARYHIDASRYNRQLVNEIAIGQSIGSWDTAHVEEALLQEKVAKIIEINETKEIIEATIAFPESLWHGKLAWLVTLLFGKMSFYPGIQLNSVWFSPNCFIPSKLGKLQGPKFSLDSYRKELGVSSDSPLLMGILKPNVAMSAQKISELFICAAEAGIHLLKDDEIRHDENEDEIIKRVEMVAQESAKRNLKTLYAVHFQVTGPHYLTLLKRLQDAGASALLVNTWTCGLDVLQTLRQHTDLPILCHPALVGAFGHTEKSYTIHPRVTLAQLLRAAGADFSLFPSPYGKLGMPREAALSVAEECQLKDDRWPIQPTIPVPSAGIKPEHGPLAKRDFGHNFVLNAGTAIFSGDQTAIHSHILNFKNQL